MLLIKSTRTGIKCLITIHESVCQPQNGTLPHEQLQAILKALSLAGLTKAGLQPRTHCITGTVIANCTNMQDSTAPAAMVIPVLH